MTKTRITTTKADVLLGISVALAALVLYFDFSTKSLLLMAAPFTLTLSISLYARVQNRKGSGYLPVLGFVMSAIQYFGGMLL